MSEAISLITISIIVFSLAPLRKIFFPQPLLSKEKASSRRIEYFDFLKGIAMISVIVIHVVYMFYYFNANNNDIFLNIVNNFNRFAISVFFICSGILLTAKNSGKINYSKFYYDKIIRIFIPYIIFNFIIAGFKGSSVLEFYYSLISGNASVPYYFIILLLQFYVLFPFINRFRDSRKFLILSFLISLVSFLAPQTWTFYGVMFFGKFLFFFVYGMYARNYFLYSKIREQDSIYWWFIVFLYALIFVAIPQHYYNVRLFYGVAVFNLFFIYKEKILSVKNDFFKTICFYGRFSLWIFLTHFFLVNVSYLFFGLFNFNYYIYFIITSVFSILISLPFGLLCSMAYNRILRLVSIKNG